MVSNSRALIMMVGASSNQSTTQNNQPSNQHQAIKQLSIGSFRSPRHLAVLVFICPLILSKIQLNLIFEIKKFLISYHLA